MKASTPGTVSDDVLRKRLLDSVIKTESGCWEWQRCRSSDGYGRLYFRGNVLGAHVASFRLFREDFVPGLCVLHTCDNPPCCNPEHLFLGTNQDNVNDKVAKGRQSGMKGESHGMAKLTQVQVDQIRELYAAGGMRQIDIGRIFGISQVSVHRIIVQKAWKQ